MNFRLDRYLEIQEQVDIKIDEFLDQVEAIYAYFQVEVPFESILFNNF